MERLAAPDKYADIFKEAIHAEVIRRHSRAPSNREHVWASTYHDCDRRMVLDMVRGDAQPMADPELMGLFEYGRQRERSLNALAEAAGEYSKGRRFRIVDIEQKLTLRGQHNKPLVSCRVDGVVQFEDGFRIVYDDKSWDPHFANGLREWDDLFHRDWTRKAAFQVAGYCVAKKTPACGILVDRRGLPNFIHATREQVEPMVKQFKDAAGRALEHRERYVEAAENGGKAEDQLPEYTQDRGLCRRCWCNGHVCFPPSGVTQGTRLVTDEELILEAEQLEKMEREVGEKAKDLDRLRKRFRERWYDQLKQTPVMAFGEVVAQATWGKYTKTREIPPAVKARIDEVAGRVKALKQPYQFSDPQGSLRKLEVMRIEDPAGDTQKAREAAPDG